MLDWVLPINFVFVSSIQVFLLVPHFAFLNPFYTEYKLFCHIYNVLEESIFSLRGVTLCILRYFVGKWLDNLQNSGDSNQMPYCVASDLGLHFLPIPI